MTTETGTPIPGDEGRIDRRRLLQGAVAAGVGVVAWSSPSITSIAGTPAYAAVCTGGSVRNCVGHRNTSCDCYVAAGTSYIGYFAPDTTRQCQNNDPCSATSGSRTVTFNFGTNDCAPGSNKKGTNAAGTATVTIGPETTGPEFCVLEIQVVQGNCSTVVLGTAQTTFVGSGGGTVPMPLQECGSTWSSSNIFTRYYLECADDPACL